MLDANGYTKMKNDPKKIVYCISCINENMPFTKLTDPDYYAAVKKGVMLSDEVIQNDNLSAVNCQILCLYIEFLYSQFCFTK